MNKIDQLSLSSASLPFFPVASLTVLHLPYISAAAAAAAAQPAVLAGALCSCQCEEHV
jgi:hypothetical protein